MSLKKDLKLLLANNLMLPIKAEDISDETPLFGPQGLGLDSVDALQLVVALEKEYGLKITDAAAASQILQSINSMAAAIENHRQSGAGQASARN